jgi:hypothetical protein
MNLEGVAARKAQKQWVGGETELYADPQGRNLNPNEDLSPNCGDSAHGALFYRWCKGVRREVSKGVENGCKPPFPAIPETALRPFQG